MNNTQLTLHSYTWSQWGFMNVPSFTGSNKAGFLFLYTKSLTAGRGTAWTETEGWMTLFFHLFWTVTFVHTVNTFLQPNGMLSCSSLTWSPVYHMNHSQLLESAQKHPDHVFIPRNHCGLKSVLVKLYARGHTRVPVCRCIVLQKAVNQ